MELITFVPSTPNSLGIELELQLIHPRSNDLAAASEELLAQIADQRFADRVKPEITRSMIELNSSVHEHPMGLLVEMREMRDALCEAADAVGVAVSGGGTHPFMRWQDRAISDTPRFQYLAEMYGYLARQFTVFGHRQQHRSWPRRHWSHGQLRHAHRLSDLGLYVRHADRPARAVHGAGVVHAGILAALGYGCSGHRHARHCVSMAWREAGIRWARPAVQPLRVFPNSGNPDHPLNRHGCVVCGMHAAERRSIARL